MPDRIRRRLRPQSPTHQHRWMVSYLDVMTILLIFFITAAAMNWKNVPPRTSRPDAAPFAPQPIAPPRDASQTGRPADPALAAVEEKLKREGLPVRPLRDSTDEDSDAAPNGNTAPDSDPMHDAGAVAAPAGQRGLAISLPQAVLFSPGDDRIRPAALSDLEKIAEALRPIPNKVNLAGHADSAPVHNRRFRNNWELAAARSLRLMEVLTQRYGIDESRVSISSYGSSEPKSRNDTPGGRASNRRVEILVFSEPESVPANGSHRPRDK